MSAMLIMQPHGGYDQGMGMIGQHRMDGNHQTTFQMEQQQLAYAQHAMASNLHGAGNAGAGAAGSGDDMGNRGIRKRKLDATVVAPRQLELSDIPVSIEVQVRPFTSAFQILSECVLCRYLPKVYVRGSHTKRSFRMRTANSRRSLCALLRLIAALPLPHQGSVSTSRSTRTHSSE
eukprot:SAG11_NODE_4807_length_1760_cov_0.962071_1_plen_176_part_00